MVNTSNGNGNCAVLPGEVWRVVFSFLRVGDLCRCALISKEWHALVDSIDATRWKELYLEQRKHKRWKHPFWPNEMKAEPKSWKDLYRKRYKASRVWLQEALNPTCGTKFLFGRSRERQKFYVGFNKPYRSIKSALDKASPFDCIFVYPGIYQDPTTLVIKFPCAIIGVEDPSKVQLKMQIDVRADSVKLENLCIKPMYPRAGGRSSSFNLLKIFSGHIFIFNCIFDQGHIHVVSPGVVDIHSSLFTTAFINLQGISYSSILNCQFQPDRFAIFVEEPLFQFRLKPSTTPEDVGGWVSALNEKKFNEYYQQYIKEKARKGDIYSNLIERTTSLSSCLTGSELSLSDNDVEMKSKSKSTSSKKSRFGSFRASNKQIIGDDEPLDNYAKQIIKAVQGVIINNIKVSGGRGAITICRMGQAWIENSTFHDTAFGIRCLQSSKCILLNNKIYSCETTGICMRDHSLGFIAGNEVYANGEAGIDIRSSADPLIQHNEIHGGCRSGIVCLDNGKGLIRDNNIYNNKEAGIYILHKGCPKVKNNHIWSGRAAGIAVTEDGQGHISNNVISGMEWAGIDIRHGGNPVISHNLIQNGNSDGIVIGEGGKSVILDNTIEDNSGCGIWILDGSHPLIHSNRILNSGNSGIAFVNNVDHEHNNQLQNAQFSQARQHQMNNDLDEPSMVGEDDFVFPLPVFEQEPESRFVHGISIVDVLVSKPEKKLAQVEGNTIENNKGHGILYEGKEGIIISKNKINCNANHGIDLIHTSEVTIENNTLSNNQLSGVNVELGINSTLQGNGIYDNGEYGIITAGIGLIKENDIFGHLLPGIFVRSIANLSVQKNRLHATKHSCIQAEEKSRCVLEQNVFYVTSDAKDIIIHAISDVTVGNDNITNRIDSNDSCEDLDKLKSRSAISEIKDWRPLTTDPEVKSAPFYTAVQLHNQNQRRLNISAFCVIL